MAGESVGSIGLDLEINQKGFNKQLNSIQGLAKKAGVAIAAAFAVKKLVDFSKQCLELGSDLAEVQNVVDVAFPKMNKQIDNFAKNAITQFGLSETMAKQYAGTFGAMSQSFGFTEKAAAEMSTTLTGLAGDVASFYNIQQSEAYTKLKSVFTGETESLKDLGVVMTQTALDAYAMANGFGKTTKSMSESEKVALRYAFIQDKLSFAMGDFARTSGSWANQVRILTLQFDSLKATIGQGLINLFTPIIKVINTLVGKLMILANAFKAFTELITGNKSSAGGGVSDVAAAAGDAETGLGGAAGAADDLAGSTSDVGKAAKKAAKEMQGLAGFDKLNNMTSSQDSDSGSGGGSGGGASGLTGGEVDFGELAEGETTLDKLLEKFQPLINKAKELAALFKQGFELGFGDSEKNILRIQGYISSIGSSLKEILTDKDVVNAADTFLNSLALNMGKAAGSMASIGVTIATNLTGGIATYLEQNKDYIKDRIVGIFNVGTSILDQFGNLAVDIADIFSTFANADGVQITADIIGIFVNAGLGIQEVFLRDINNLMKMITVPISENKDKIKEAIENTLKPISKVTTTIREAITKTFEKIFEVYEQYIDPAFDRFAQGWSNVCGGILDGYNEYLAPVLDWIADRFGKLVDTYIQPMIDEFLELWGQAIESVSMFWEFISPFVAWLAKSFFAVIGTKLKWLWTQFESAIAAISTIVKGLLKVLKGLVKFVTGVLTGDWQKAWDGIKDVFSAFWETIKGIVQIGIDFVSNLFSTGFTAIKNVVSVVFDGIKLLLSTLWETIKTIFTPLVEWLGGIFAAALLAIQTAFSGIGQWFSNRWTDICNAFSAVGTWFGDRFDEAYQAIVALFKGIGKWFGERWKDICNVFKDIKTWFTNKFKLGVDGVKAGFAAAKTKVSEIYTAIQNLFSSIKTWFTNKFGEAVDGVQAGFAAAKTKVDNVFTLIKGLFDAIKETFKGFFDKAAQGVYNGFSTATGKVRTIYKNIKAVFVNIKSAFKNIFDKAVDGIKSAFDGIEDFFKGIWKKIKGVFEDKSIDIPVNTSGNTTTSTKSVSTSSIGTTNVPLLASGGYVKRNTPQLAIIGDNKHQGEVVAPEDKLEEMAAKAAKNAQGDVGSLEMLTYMKEIIDYLKVISQQEPKTIIDGKEVFTVVKKQGKEYTTRTGKPAFID